MPRSQSRARRREGTEELNGFVVVTLSEAKGLARIQARCFATLSMTAGCDTSFHDLSANPFVGEDFQQDGMRNPTIHEMHATHPGLHGFDGAVHFRDHALVDDAFVLQPEYFRDVKAGNQRVGIAWGTYQPGHVAQEHESARANG